MSIEVMNAVWRHSKSDGRARLVLLAIADHQGEIGAWPSIQTLARMVNASERSVQRDIQYLVSIGELSVSVQKLCADYAITAREPLGVWGGTTPQDR